jgi:hypothetical protein
MDAQNSVTPAYSTAATRPVNAESAKSSRSVESRMKRKYTNELGMSSACTGPRNVA